MAVKTASERKCIVLVGTTGVGKSTLGNSILGLTTACGSNEGFATNPTTQSCTDKAQFIDGSWMGDKSKQIRVYDTPGHGDSQGRDSLLRESIVKGLQEQRFVHTFVWVKNSQAPKFDHQDKEFFRIFFEMFGPGVRDHLIVVLTSMLREREAEMEAKMEQAMKQPQGRRLRRRRQLEEARGWAAKEQLGVVQEWEVQD